MKNLIDRFIPNSDHKLLIWYVHLRSGFTKLSHLRKRGANWLTNQRGESSGISINLESDWSMPEMFG